MTANDVIATIESSTQALFTVLRTQEENIAQLEAKVSRLQERIDWLEGQLESARSWGREVTEQRNKAQDTVTDLNVQIANMRADHAEGIERLMVVVRAVNAAINPIINPPYVPKPGEQPRDETGRFRPWSELSESERDSASRGEYGPEHLTPAAREEHERKLPEGVTAVPLNDPEKLHETIREAVGEDYKPLTDRAVGW